MSSIAYSLYDDNARNKCYTCPDSGSGTVKVRGQQRQLECRKFTEIGNATETRMSARQTDIFQTNLIDIVPIGVDTARLSFGKKFKFKTQSRGSGGLSKYECAVDYQIPELIRHDKLGYTEMLYVHYKGCPKQLISTELQDMVYENDAYSDSYDPNNALSDALIMAARETVSEQIQYCDIVGVFGGANERANAYDGILAQAYWAYTGLAFFHSLKFAIDETVLIDGMYLHAKYAGLEIDLLLDSSQETDRDMESYASRQELYDRLVEWMNEEVTTASGRKYVDATYVNNNIIVTSKWAEETVNLQMFVDSENKVESWAACDVFTGVSYETLQGAMPIDERPILVEYKKYTAANIIYDLPNDIHKADMEMDSTLMDDGQTKTLYIDDYLYKTYRNALKTRKQDATSYDLEDDYTVYTLDALSEHGGTGIWFLTVSSGNAQQRNVAHLIDVQRANTDDIFLGFTDNSCREIQMLYDVLHGVMVKDFRLFASNLLCSPFAKTLKEPYEKTVKMIPCYNRAVRSTFIDPASHTQGCKINAGFEKVDEYRNGALYMLNGNIEVLEAGATMPTGAKPIYEIQFKDRTVGIPVSLVDQVVYEYRFTTDEGVEVVLTGKDPIFQYAGDAAGTTFNVTQSVTLPNGCADTFDASGHYEDDYPFELRGECDNVALTFDGRIDNVEGQYKLTLLDGTTYDEGDGLEVSNIFVYETGTAKPVAATFDKMSTEARDIADHSANGWTVELDLETKFGCNFNGLTGTINGPIADGANVSFQVTN